MDEDVRVLGRFVGSGTLRMGLPVELTFARSPDGAHIPVFTAS
jgi:hypothetical protein